MAVDKLVDSTKLDACCTAEANAIRAKTGGSSQLTFDWANSKGFADAIAAIPSGGGGVTITKDQYTQAVDWLSANGATSGTSAAVINTYCTRGDGLYVLYCTNNSASTKRFDKMVCAKGNSFNYNISVRDSTNVASVSNTATSRDLFIKAGASIVSYYLPWEAFS